MDDVARSGEQLLCGVPSRTRHEDLPREARGPTPVRSRRGRIDGREGPFKFWWTLNRRQYKITKRGVAGGRLKFAKQATRLRKKNMRGFKVGHELRFKKTPLLSQSSSVQKERITVGGREGRVSASTFRSQRWRDVNIDRHNLPSGFLHRTAPSAFLREHNCLPTYNPKTKQPESKNTMPHGNRTFSTEPHTAVQPKNEEELKRRARRVTWCTYALHRVGAFNSAGPYAKRGVTSAGRLSSSPRNSPPALVLLLVLSPSFPDPRLCRPQCPLLPPSPKLSIPCSGLLTDRIVAARGRVAALRR